MPTPLAGSPIAPKKIVAGAASNNGTKFDGMHQGGDISPAVPSVARALEALDGLARDLGAAKTYIEIRRIIREAKAIAILLGHVDTVKAKAEDAILFGNRRIGEEIEKVAKVSGGDRKSNVPRAEHLKVGREDLAIPRASRSRLQKLAATPLRTIRDLALSLRSEGKDVTVSAVLAALKKRDQAATRNEKLERLAAKVETLPEKLYSVIYADPPWQFSVRSENGKDRSAENHYPLMTPREIADLDVPAAPDAVLFLWATIPLLPQAIWVLEEWGFVYKSAVPWDKGFEGTGFWVRNQVELLLIGSRGDIPAPLPGHQFPGLLTLRKTHHSAKPQQVAVMIADMFPEVAKLEMFAREARLGWDRWGNEAPVDEATEREDQHAL